LDHSHAAAYRLAILAAVALAALVLWLARERWLGLIGDYLIIQDPLQPADVIHVIAGDDYRTDYAVRLYQQGKAPSIFFSGGWCTTHGYYHGQHGKELSLAEGVSLQAIGMDDAPVTSTYMEAERLKAWIESSPRPIRSVIVVTDPFSMRRTSWVYQWVFGSRVTVQMAPVPFDETPFQRAWWKDAASRAYVKDEYAKLAYNLLRYRLSSGAFQQWLAKFDTQ
jgi:uncharacterized SAM-binding protein YcdF (DUF218 family)